MPSRNSILPRFLLRAHLRECFAFVLLVQGAVLIASTDTAPYAEPPQMAGVNLASAAFGGVYPGVVGTHYGYPGEDDLDYHKARGMELIRLPFRWERIQQSLYAELDPGELGRLDTFLDAAEERGMLVIPDMHNFGRYTIDEVQYIIGSPEVPRSAFADVWERLAAHMKDRQCIWGWGIMNEPYSMGNYTWKDTAQVGVDAVRKHDRRHPIFIGGDGYSGAHSWMKYSADLHEIVDPAENLIFEAHQYFDADHSGRYVHSYDGENAYPDVGVDRLKDFVNWCQTHGVRGFIGEYGVPDDDPRWLVPLDRMLTYMKANNMSGTYWAAGPRWGGYKLRSNVRPNHDESPQMTAMLPHADGHGTGYWPPFTWYADAVSSGAKGSYKYDYKSETALLEADFDHATSAYSGNRGIRLAYSVPPGGWAGGGMHINGGINLSANAQRNHILSFYAKSNTGGSVRVFFFTEHNKLSLKLDTNRYTPLSSEWQRIEIPLSDFFNANFDGSQRVTRLSVEGLPINGSAQLVQLDHFVIERPDTEAPLVEIDTSHGLHSVSTGVPLTATAEASDPGGSLDFVEFQLNGRRFATVESAPYAAEFTLVEPGVHRLSAVAFDSHGNPRRSNSLELIASLPTEPSFEKFQSEHFTLEERADPTFSGPEADPDKDGRTNLLEYALGTNPRETNQTASTLPQLDVGTHLELSYTRVANASDLDFTVQITDALHENWNSGPAFTETKSVQPLDAKHEHVVERALQTVDAYPQAFMRLQVEETQP